MTILVCIGVFQMSLADLIISVRHKSIMNFRIAPERLVSRYASVFRFAYDGRGAWAFKVLMVLCAALGIGLVLSGRNPAVPLITLLISQLLSYPRWKYFVSTDSPLLRAILLVLILHYLLPFSQVITEAGLLFISLYLVLIYHLTAIQKLKSNLWRNGQAIENFLNRFAFWRSVSPATIQSKWLPKAAAWTVMLFELCFFIGLIWPEAGLSFVITGLIFHGGLSFSVGINHFFWTFISGYPAYFYVSGKVSEILSNLI